MEKLGTGGGSQWREEERVGGAGQVPEELRGLAQTGGRRGLAANGGAGGETGEGMGRGSRDVARPSARAGPCSGAPSCGHKQCRSALLDPSSHRGLTCPKHRTARSPEALGDLPCVHTARPEEELLWGRLPAAASSPLPSFPA